MAINVDRAERGAAPAASLCQRWLEGARGRTDITKAGITSTYSYDANGQRIRKYNSTGAASTVIFVYDQNGQLLGEYNSAGAAIREYVWLGSTPIAIFTPDAVAANPPVAYYIHTDHLDTPRYVLNRAGQKRWSWLAEPFGTTASDSNPAGLGAFTQNLRFPGQYADSESGLNYNYFRDYEASIGRYVQSDPIGLDGGANTYAYVSGDPLSRIDPNGLKDYIDKCVGRYEMCKPTQNSGSFTPINWGKWKACEWTVDKACERGGTYCCDREREACLATAVGDAVETAKCMQESVQCISKIGK